MKRVLVSGSRHYSPKWDKGDRIGQFLVISDPQYKSARKDRKLWVYELRCNCGNEETLHQEQLNGGRVDCLECMQRRKAPSQWPAPRAIELVRRGDIPDFARLPAPSLVRGPESY